MKILYLIANASLNPDANTGYGRHIRETVSGLQNLDHDVKVMCAGKFESVQDGVKAQEIKPARGALKKFRSFLPSIIWESVKDIKQLLVNRQFKRAVRKSIESFQPDAVYERTCYLSNTIQVNDFYKLPWYLEINAPFVKQRERISGKSVLSVLAHRFELLKYRRANHLFCVSKVLEDYISDRYNIASERITVNHNGVDEKLFKPHSSQKAEKGDRFTFGFVGSIMPYHGVEMLVDAFAEIKPSIPNARLLIVGDGELLSNLKQRAIELDILTSVQFTGGVAQAEVPVFIAQMDVCIMPNSNWYGSPVKLFEYGIMCKPIIAPKLPPVMEVIENKVDGLLVDGQKELEEAMCFCYENPSRAMEMALAFKEKVQSKFTWKKNVQRIEDTIQVY